MLNVLIPPILAFPSCVVLVMRFQTDLGPRELDLLLLLQILKLIGDEVLVPRVLFDQLLQALE